MTMSLVSDEPIIYDGEVHKPKVKLGEVLVENQDYVLSYLDKIGKAVDPTNAGEYSIEAKGEGNFGGSKTIKFSIKPRSLKGAIASLDENGEVISVKLTDGSFSKILTPNEDYKVEYKEDGTAKITGKSNYTGEIYARNPDDDHVGGTYYKLETGEKILTKGSGDINLGTSPTKYPWGDFIGNDGTNLSETTTNAQLEDKVEDTTVVKDIEAILEDPLGIFRGDEVKLEIVNATINLGNNYDGEYNPEKQYKVDVILKVNGQPVSGQLPGKVRILLEIPDDPDNPNDDWDDFEIQALRINEDSDTEYVEALEYRLYDLNGNFVKVVDKDYELKPGEKLKKFIAIWTDHFSEYALVDPEDPADVVEDSNGKINGLGLKTGESLNIIYISVTLISLAVCAIYVEIKKRKKI